MIADSDESEPFADAVPQLRKSIAQERLNAVFGGYKAEWLRERVFDFFSEPAYFPDLKTSRPCVLIGGRGTGKTTVLRCLSYEGQFALNKQDLSALARSEFFGIYYRVNTNRVTAFHGPELRDDEWRRLFGHYMNLLLCGLGVRFLLWYQRKLPSTDAFPASACERIAVQLHLGGGLTTANDLQNALSNAQSMFEAYINNVGDGHRPPLSLQGAPVDALFDEIASLPQFQGRDFFFLIDEYENFSDDQQQIMNTFIKHSGQPYSFKIGVKELGWRQRSPLNENEPLISPADYVRIDIGDKLSGPTFAEFAMGVCNTRLSELANELRVENLNVRRLLPSLSDEAEADLLGLKPRADQIRSEMRSALNKKKDARIEEASDLEIYFADVWSKSQGVDHAAVIAEWSENPASWATRFDNYKYALLFTIRTGKRGINKYYAGWETFLLLSGSNIRYVLELVEQTLLVHLREERGLDAPVSPATQTLAAQAVGHKNLTELEGLDVAGARLTKLLLGLGRVFQIMARDVVGHAPEVNQFHLSQTEISPVKPEFSSSSTDPDVDMLLTKGVMHLALVRSPGSKLAARADTRDYDYMVHPIFSPFFVFSHRRKRKMQISPSQLRGLVESPRQAIQSLLAQSNRDVNELIPEQLLLFEAYYSASA